MQDWRTNFYPINPHYVFYIEYETYKCKGCLEIYKISNHWVKFYKYAKYTYCHYTISLTFHNIESPDSSSPSSFLIDFRVKVNYVMFWCWLEDWKNDWFSFDFKLYIPLHYVFDCGAYNICGLSKMSRKSSVIYRGLP